jgi:hypothetical protein
MYNTRVLLLADHNQLLSVDSGQWQLGHCTDLDADLHDELVLALLRGRVAEFGIELLR